MPELDRKQEIFEFTISFEPYITELVEDMLTNQMTALGFPDRDNPGAVAGSRDASALGVATVLSALRVPDDLPTVLPGASARTVRRAVQYGVSLDTLLRSYRLGHGVFQEHIFRHVARVGLSMGALRDISDTLFRYYDRVSDLVARAYAHETAQLRSSVDRERQLRIERVLAGATGESLGYELDQVHIAVVLDPECRAETPRRLREGLGGVELLANATPSGHTWIWVAAESVTVEQVVAQLEASLGEGHAGISEPEAGPHGFAGAHRKAVIALRLGILREVRVGAYRDVALEALAFGGEEIAVDFVRAELGRLIGDSQRVTMLRETLLEYFANNSSTAATARVLAIAERTVTYRLRRAEELLGRPLSQRRADLETALRLYGVLNV